MAEPLLAGQPQAAQQGQPQPATALPYAHAIPVATAVSPYHAAQQQHQARYRQHPQGPQPLLSPRQGGEIGG